MFLIYMESIFTLVVLHVLLDVFVKIKLMVCSVAVAMKRSFSCC